MLRFFALAALSGLILIPANSLATVWRVPAEYATIQDGIDAAAVGDTVLLDSGVYFGLGNRDIDFLGKDITVRSHDGNPSTCTIFCSGTPSDPHRGFIFQSGESSLARLEGVTISEGSAYGDDNMEFHGGGIICRGSSSPTISNCRITQCEAALSPVTISNCTLIDNGTAIYAPYHSTVENTLIAFNEYAIHDFGVPLHNISCSNIYGNANGDWVATVAHHANINGNISAEPLLCDPDNWDYRVAPDSPCLGGICGQIGAFGVGQCGPLSPVIESPELSFRLKGNHPNPFNPSTSISFSLDRESAVRLQVYDISGKLVQTLVDAASMVVPIEESIRQLLVHSQSLGPMFCQTA